VMANELQDVELVVVQDTGHFVHLENPELVQEKINEFLA